MLPPLIVLRLLPDIVKVNDFVTRLGLDFLLNLVKDLSMHGHGCFKRGNLQWRPPLQDAAPTELALNVLQSGDALEWPRVFRHIVSIRTELSLFIQDNVAGEFDVAVRESVDCQVQGQ